MKYQIFYICSVGPEIGAVCYTVNTIIYIFQVQIFRSMHRISREQFAIEDQWHNVERKVVTIVMTWGKKLLLIPYVLDFCDLDSVYKDVCQKCSNLPFKTCDAYVTFITVILYLATASVVFLSDDVCEALTTLLFFFLHIIACSAFPSAATLIDSLQTIWQIVIMMQACVDVKIKELSHISVQFSLFI